MIEYETRLIKEESTSELLRFTMRHILKQAHNQPEYLILVQEQQQHQKQVQNNQQKQQLHNQVILPSPPPTSIAYHQSQVHNISRTNNFIGQKMTPWKLSSLLSR
jgi:transcription initiation factor TFIID subunit TAF12